MLQLEGCFPVSPSSNDTADLQREGKSCFQAGELILMLKSRYSSKAAWALSP